LNLLVVAIDGVCSWLREGVTENAVVVKDFLSDLIGHGPGPAAIVREGIPHR